MEIISKQRRTMLVDAPIELLSARPPMMNIPEGLWQSLKRKSAITQKPFPPGSNIVMVMYEQDGLTYSGAVHLEELPDSIREVVESNEMWKEVE